MPRALLKPRYFALLGAVVVSGLGVSLDWRLLSRALNYPDRPITMANWYQPQQRVAGGEPPAPPLPRVSAQSQSAIPVSALEAAAAFAEAQNSVALLVLHRDQLVLERYWQGFRSDQRVNGMSMTKTLIALLIGIAIEEGHIASMHDPLNRYIPEWSDDARGRLTLADLLYMQSGLKNDDRTNTLRSDLVQLYGGSDVRKTALQIPLLSPPGQRFDYNNVNSQLLGLVLEAATGEPIDRYLSSRLWQPLRAADGFLWLDRPGGTAKTFCCFFATAQDWARVGQLLLHQGRVGNQPVVPAAWIEQMRVASPLESTFGLHLWLKARTKDYPAVRQAASAPFLASDTFYLDGRHHQRVYVIPSYELVVVRLGEEPPAWDDAVIPNLLVAGLQTQ